MHKPLPAGAMVFVAACQAQPERIEATAQTHAPTAAPAAIPSSLAAAPAPKPFVRDATTPLLEFHYAWPAEVSAVPQLVLRLTDEMNARQAKLSGTAASDKAFREKEGYPFHAYTSSTDWLVAGDSPRLLSLAAQWSEYTGGAHGMHGTRALLWDRTGAEPLDFGDLFSESAAVQRLLEARWCTGIKAERRKKRSPDAMTGGIFNACPELSDLTLVPIDSDGDQRLDTIGLYADPYVAGPYAEGSYAVALPVTPAFIAALKPDYRASFEVQPPQ
jgi:hypothetical protein